jgi:hypothetical protein
MQFLLIIGHDNSFSPSTKLTQEIISWNNEMRKLGLLEYSNPLVPYNEAITIKVRNGKTIKIDGSFSNSKEKIAAYALIKCEGIEEAIKAAEKHPMAREATIEIREVWENLGSI